MDRSQLKQMRAQDAERQAEEEERRRLRAGFDFFAPAASERVEETNATLKPPAAKHAPASSGMPARCAQPASRRRLVVLRPRSRSVESLASRSTGSGCATRACSPEGRGAVGSEQGDVEPAEFWARLRR